ncbi:MAG: hypothetical protein HDT39_01885 [Lachnospiraceae bacterium]|nr:hypothetical protein [Lachnospiraceae bacterium]
MNFPKSQGSEKSGVALKDSLRMLFSSAHMIAVFAQGEIKLEGETILDNALTVVQLIQTGEVVSGAPFSAIFADGVIGGMVGVGCLAKSALTVTVRTLGIEIPTSGLLSDFVSGVFLKEDEDTENSLKIVQKYIEQYGY